MHTKSVSFTKALSAIAAIILCFFCGSLQAQVDIPASAAISGPSALPGGSLKGEYWHRPPVSIFTDGTTVPEHRIDTQINGFGTADATFTATSFVYLGNDLTPVLTWLGADAASFVGTPNNLDDAAIRLRGFINRPTAGVLSLGTTSDDGARITIAGIDITNGDGSHGDETHDMDVNFLAAGVYPIEVTYFAGDWTSDSLPAPAPPNHSGSLDPGVHGGDNFHLRIGGVDVSATTSRLLFPTPPPVITTIPNLISATGTVWKYLANTADPVLTPADAWTAPAFNDTAWSSGRGLFGYESSANIYDGVGIFNTYIVPPNGVAAGSPIFPGQASSPLSAGPSGAGTGGPSAYFRTHFNWTASTTASVTFVTTNAVDDGIIVYLNGVELYSFNMPDTRPMTWDVNNLTANPAPFSEPSIYPTNLYAANLVNGDNVLAVELHQAGTGSSDDVFGMSIQAILPLAPAITNPDEPADRSVFANATTTLTVQAVGAPAPTYQWYHDGVAIDPLVNPSAATASYTIPVMQASDAGNYFARVSNAIGTVDSRTAAVAYNNDSTPPSVVEVGGSATFDRISVLFDGLVDPGTAGDAFNYTLSGGLSADTVTLNADGTSVVIKLLGLMDPDTVYSVTVENVKDLAGNTLPAGGTTVSFRSWVTGWCSGVNMATYPGGGTAVSGMTSLAIYPNSPDFRTFLSVLDIRTAVDPANPTFYSTDARENYGGRLTGYYMASESGPHTFYFASDDNGEFWLSTDERPAHKVMVARESAWSNTKEWGISGGSSLLTSSGATKGKKSLPVNLTAGHAYYFEALYKEGGGGDNCAVAVQLPSQTTPPVDGADAIGAASLGTVAPANFFGPIVIGTEPADQTVAENSLVTISVVLSGPAFDGQLVPVCYQWRRNGTAIPGANLSSYTLGLATTADDGATFDCTLGISGANAVTRTATLHVVSDVIPPACVSAGGGFTSSNLVVRFSEIVSTGTAEDLFNYTVTGLGNIPVVGAVRQADGSNVVLTVEGILESGRNYSVHVDNVADLSGNPVPAPGCDLAFSISSAGGYSAVVLADNPIAYWRYNDAPPTAINAGSLGAAAAGTYHGGATPGSEAPKPPLFPGLESGNTALQCNGTDAFMGTTLSLLNSTPVFTISGWIRRDGDQNNRTGLWGQNDIVEFGYIANQTLEAWTDNGLDIPNAIPNGEWAHLAIVSDGSPGTISMYTNGVLAGSRAHTLPADNAFVFNVGGGGIFDDGVANGNFFKGQIDEVAVFGTALPAAKILAQYHSALVSPGYSFDDGFLPAGTIATGTTPPYVLDGVLHLSDQVNGQLNYWTIPLDSTVTYQTLTARWRTKIEGVGGADGISFNAGQTLGTSFTPEDGAGNGLSVCIDTYNNGATPDQGLDIKWNGATLTHLQIGPATDGAGGSAELAIGSFVDTSVDVTASGHVTFRYATMVIEADIPGYAGLTANMYVFAARTGGANENAWIDDVIIRGETLPGPTITTQPADQSVPVGETATFSVVATGTDPLAYQWSRKLSGEASFTPIAGATTASYTTAATAYPADDLAQFKVQVTDANGTVNSGPATLHVVPPGTPVVQWTVGKKDGGWPVGDGGGANASFVQENGSIQPLPGSPTSPEADQQADNDYYFAGDYSTAIDSVVALYGAYTPLGPVAANEEAAERAFAGGDLDLRYHFNLPASLLPTDQISVTFSAINLDGSGADPRFGTEVYFNGVKIQDEILIRTPQLNVDYTTPRFSLASVNAKTGSGFDNIVSLKGISYNGDGGGNWMGIDYVQLNTIHIAAPESVQVVSVVSVCEPNIIHVKYNHAVLLDGEYTYNSGFVAGLSYGADHSEVLVETDPLPPNADIELTIANVHDAAGNVIDPNPTIRSLTHGFGATTADFAGGAVPAGTVAQGSTPPAVGAEGALHLTDQGILTQQNYWTIPLGGGTFTLDRIQAKWRTLLGGLGQADGFSFNVGEATTVGMPFTYTAGVNEEGSTVGLSVTIDTYDNGEMNPGSSDVGLEVRWNGVRLSYTAVAGGHVNGPAELMTGAFVDTSLDLTPSGQVTFTHGAYSTTAQIPGFTGIRVNQYEFAARTGGAAEDCWIDDVHINDFNLSGPTIGSGPNDVTTPENTTATFAVTGVQGVFPIAYQWLRNGAPIAGANGPSYSLAAVTSADNGSKFSVRLANDCGAVTSREATLTVVSAPVALSASSRGNCHAIYITYNKDVLLDGTYGVVCSNSATPVVLLNQDFNAGDGGFTVETPIAFDNPWLYSAADGRWQENGQGPEDGHANTTILTSPAINVTQAGVVQLTFAHRYSFEGGNWDGGQVRVSVNGGAFTTVPASAFSQNGYPGAVAGNSSSDLHGQDAFVNNSPNYTAGTIVSTCALGVLNAGDTVRVQFFASSDSNTQGPNAPQWDLDSLQVGSYAVSTIAITGAFYGESQNVVCLRLPTDLVADVNTYRVLITGVHDAAGAVISPNPTLKTFVHGAEYPLFSILEKRFDGIGGVNVSDLTSNPKFPNHPDLVLPNPTAFFEVPVNASGNYGVQILGWAIAPATADYRFWVSSDDGSVLYIADDGLPAHKRQIAREPIWAGSRNYTEATPGQADPNNGRGTPPANGSEPIHLTAGQVVYLEGLMKEGGGGDNFSVAVTLNDPNPPANGSDPISIQYFQPRRLGPNGEVFTRLCDVFCYAGPSDQTAFIGLSATFDFIPDGTPPWTIQWKKNGTDIPGANGTSYTTPPVTAADNGAVYTVALGNAFSSTTCSATLHVRPDPRVVDCFAKCDASTIHVLFNKPVRLDGTYTLSSGFVTGIAYGSSHAEVLITGDPLAPESTATLTIADVHSEDGFVLVPNPSTCVVHYGIGRFCVDFNDGQVPAGTIASGVTPPYVGTEGALHLTDQANSQNNFWTIPLSGTQTFPVFSAKWRTYLEGVGGADGMSFNAGVNLGTGFTPEEGAGNGLSVQIDTYNNGAADTGIEIKWNGSRIGFLPVGPGVDGQGSPAELALAQWVDTSVEVAPSGMVTFKYATYVITGQIPSFTGLQANMYVFAGRTGGANENAWIDDVCIQPFTQGAPSITQQPADATIAQECVDSATFTAVIGGTPPYNVQWLSNGVVVATINGSVSTVQSYTTPALCRDADGAHYQVVVGNECGSVTSRGALVTVTFACDATDTTPPVVTCPANITATADPATQCAIVTYTVTATDDCHLKGGVVCTPPSGTCQPVGTHTVTCTATDAAGNIGRCSFTVTVQPATGNLPPIAVISSEQLINLKPEYENPVLLSCNWWNACLVADGYSSSDPEGGVLTYLWFSDQDPVPVGAGPVVTNCVEVGTHVITLVVTDPTGLTGTESKTIEVVTAPLAIDLLIEQIDTANKSGIVISRKLQRELTATLRVALGFAGDEKLRQTQKALDTFEKKVRAEVAKGTLDATVGANWIRWSQAVSAGMEGCIKPPRKPKHDEDPDPKDPRK